MVTGGQVRNEAVVAHRHIYIHLDVHTGVRQFVRTLKTTTNIKETNKTKQNRCSTVINTVFYDDSARNLIYENISTETAQRVYFELIKGIRKNYSSEALDGDRDLRMVNAEKWYSNKHTRQ